jgi:hypothetical protein
MGAQNRCAARHLTWALANRHNALSKTDKVVGKVAHLPRLLAKSPTCPGLAGGAGFVSPWGQNVPNDHHNESCCLPWRFVASKSGGIVASAQVTAWFRVIGAF